MGEIEKQETSVLSLTLFYTVIARNPNVYPDFYRDTAISTLSLRGGRFD
jgi:hypothetical protein